jgi:hypothetical protein
MRIEMNGKFVYAEDSDLGDVLNLVCVCGHTLSEHACPMYYWEGKPYFITSQCTHLIPNFITAKLKFCCEQFRVE